MGIARHWLASSAQRARPQLEALASGYCNYLLQDTAIGEAARVGGDSRKGEPLSQVSVFLIKKKIAYPWELSHTYDPSPQ